MHRRTTAVTEAPARARGPALVVVVLLLAGCGLKGDLFLPEPEDDPAAAGDVAVTGADTAEDDGDTD